MPNANPDWIPGPAPRPARRRRRVGRTLAIVLVLLVAPIAGCRIWDSVETRKFWAAIDAIEARGERLEPDVPVPETDEERQASRLYAEAVRQVMRVNRTRFEALGAAIKEIASAPQPSRHPKLADLRAFEQEYAAALDAADRAVALGPNGAASSDMNRLGGFEQALERVNAVRVARLAFEGQGDDAAGALETTLRLRRGFPLTFGRWVLPRTSHSLELVLSHTRPADARLLELAREYEHFATLQRLDAYVIDQRARFLALMMPEEFGGTPPRGRMSPLQGVFAVMARPRVTRRFRQELEDFEAAVDLARTPFPAVLEVAQSKLVEVEAEQAQRRGRRGFLSRFLRPWFPRPGTHAFGSATPRIAANLVNTHASLAAIAVARHRAANGGALPATLSELVPKYLSSAPMDPYSGEVLRYVRTGTGFTVYSVAANKTDDGGQWERFSDLNPFRRGEPRDVGIAVAYTESIPPGRSVSTSRTLPRAAAADAIAPSGSTMVKREP